jgi:hypothetical protein
MGGFQHKLLYVRIETRCNFVLANYFLSGCDYNFTLHFFQHVLNWLQFSCNTRIALILTWSTYHILINGHINLNKLAKVNDYSNHPIHHSTCAGVQSATIVQNVHGAINVAYFPPIPMGNVSDVKKCTLIVISNYWVSSALLNL